VFGMSEGGSMSMLFATTYPDRTLALVLYGAFAKRAWSPDYPWAPRPEERQRWYELFEHGWGGTTDLDVKAPSLAHDEAFSTWWSTYLRLGASPGEALALARFNTEIDTRDLLPVIRVPTLILHRTGDRDVNIEEARYLAARIPGSDLVELPGEDHLIYAGEIDPLIDRLQSFVTLVHARRPDERTRVLSTIAVLQAATGAPEEMAPLVRQHCAAQRGRPLGWSSRHWVVSFDGPGRAIQAVCDIVAAARQRGVLRGRRGDRDGGDPRIAQHGVELAERRAIALGQRRGSDLVGIADRGECAELGKVAHQVAAPIAATDDRNPHRFALRQQILLAMLPQSG